VEKDVPIIQPVILAGGSGARLWPASRQSHPKQLLVLTGSQTMLQQTALRLQGFAHAPLAQRPLLITNEDYRFIVADQLAQVGISDCRIVLEPVARNTAPALTVAALLVREGADASDPILLVMPSDHLIADLAAFHLALAEGAEQAAAGAVVVFGVTPTTPETGYGYIRTGETLSGAGGLLKSDASPPGCDGHVREKDAESVDSSAIYATEDTLSRRPVRSGGRGFAFQQPPGTARALAAFTEKPDTATARRYLAEGGYLWNSGMFMVRASVWLAAIDQCRPDIGAACGAAVAGAHADGVFVRLDKTAFAACASESIDYAVMEHLGRQCEAPSTGAGAAAQAAPFRGAVIPLIAGWSDLGAWDAVWAASPKDEAGNVIRGNVIVEEGRGSLVQAQSRLVAALGIEDLAIIETADAVLVAKRDRTADLKKLVDRVAAHDKGVTQIHRRVYRPWGWYESIDQGPRFQVKRLMVAPGASMSLQYHQHRAEHWVVVTGVAEVTCDGRVFRLEENAFTYVPPLAPHRLANPGVEPVEIIEVQSGDYLGEDDIVRLEDNYGRIEGR
jgi:mannose-1-phosphate guanylyltransferase/mannose-6-phosphate isomerase